MKYQYAMSLLYLNFNISIYILMLVFSLIQDAQNLKKMKRNSKIGKEIVAV
jgi:hypothetical protein